MGRRLAPHSVARLDQVAALVRDHAADQPLTTNELGDLMGLNAYERGVILWPALDRLAKQGKVTRIRRDGGGCRLWQWVGGSSSE